MYGLSEVSPPIGVIKDRKNVVQEGSLITPLPWLSMMVVRCFLDGRDTVQTMDGNALGIIAAIAGETREAEQEMNQPAAEYDAAAHNKELIDILFFIDSCSHALSLNLDYDRIRRNIGRYQPAARRSDFYDRHHAISGEVFGSTVTQPRGEQKLISYFETVYSATLAAMMTVPEVADPLVVMRQVLAKNNRNYPVEYFSKWDEVERRVLNHDEQLQKYFHATKCLRLIRTWSGSKPEGLDPKDHQPFTRWITDWRRGERAIKELSAVLNATTGGVSIG